MPSSTPVRLNLTQLKKQAKEILKAHHAGDAGAGPVLRRLPRFAAAMAPEILAAPVHLADVQFALALEHGFDSWAHLKRHIEGLEPRPRGQLMKEAGAVWISRVPKLGWGLDRDCTFAGALESALAATDDPWPYWDLMAFTGLAFRVRWSADFSASCAIGEMPDECAGLRACTGWGTPTDVQFGQETTDREAIRGWLVQSIDSGRPVLVYGLCLDMAVVYGYEAGGQILWLSDYHARGEMPVRLPLAKLGPMQIYLHREGPALDDRLRLEHVLSLAGRNWGRREHDGGLPGRRYLYGEAAYEAWQEAIRGADKLPPEQFARLHHTHQFAWLTLADARQAAGRFLNEAGQTDLARTLPETAAAALRHAIGHALAMAKRLSLAFDSQGFFQGPPPAWPADQRLAEFEILEGMKHQDALLHAEIAQALSALKA